MTKMEKIQTPVAIDGTKTSWLRWTTPMCLSRTEMNTRTYQDCHRRVILSLRKRSSRIVIYAPLSSKPYWNQENIAINADSQSVNFAHKIQGDCQNKKIGNIKSVTIAITKWVIACLRKNWKMTFCKNRNWQGKLRNTYLFMKKSKENLSPPKEDTMLSGKKKKRKSKYKKKKFKNN